MKAHGSQVSFDKKVDLRGAEDFCRKLQKKLRIGLWSGVVMASFITAACRKGGSDSGLNVVGAQRENGYPEVKLVQADQVQLGLCTGVAVSDTTMLMAGHCIKSGSIEHGIRSPDTNTPANQVIFWNAVAERYLLTMHDAARDLAVVVFPPNSLKPPYAKVAVLSDAQGMVATLSRAPRLGEQVKLVGYGATTFSAIATVQNGTLGTKNSVHNQLAEFVGIDCDENSVCDDQVIVIESQIVSNRGNGELELSAPIAASGDSGSPLFYKQDGQGELVLGIGAAVAAFDNNGTLIRPAKSPSGIYQLNIAGAAKVRNLYTDLTSTASVTLMQLAVQKGAKIPGISPLQGGLSPLDAVWMNPARVGDHGSGGYLGIFFNFGFLSGLIGGGSQGSTVAASSQTEGGRRCFFFFCFGSSSDIGGSSVSSSTGSTTTPESSSSSADDTQTATSTTPSSPAPSSSSSTDGTQVAGVGASQPPQVTSANLVPNVVAANEAFTAANRPFWDTVQSVAANNTNLTAEQRQDLQAMATNCAGQLVPRSGRCDPNSAAMMIRNADPTGAATAQLGAREKALAQATVQANDLIPSQGAGAQGFDRGLAQRIYSGARNGASTQAQPQAKSPSSTTTTTAQVVAPVSRSGDISLQTVTPKVATPAARPQASATVQAAIANCANAGTCRLPTAANSASAPRPAPTASPRPAVTPAPNARPALTPAPRPVPAPAPTSRSAAGK
jgi:hypothetical protein